MADKQKVKAKRELRRRRHVRNQVRGTSECPRLTVSKSLRNTIAQLIDDQQGATLAFASSSAGASSGGDKSNKTQSAKQVGKRLASIAQERGIKRVVFDRNRYIYHGRVRAVAEGAREGGLEF